MTDEFRYAFRAAGWISTGDRGHCTRLTLRDQADLPDADLIALGTEVARARNFTDGYVAVGIWTNIDRYIDPPEFTFSRPGPLDDVIEDKAEYALQSVLRRHPDDDEPTLVDSAHWAAQAILFDLSDRGGFELLDGGLDNDARTEIVSVLAAIVRRAMSPRRAGGASA